MIQMTKEQYNALPKEYRRRDKNRNRQVRLGAGKMAEWRPVKFI